MYRDHALLLVTALGLAFTAGCNRQTPLPASGAAALASTVTVIKPEQRSIKRVVEQPGTVEAYEETALHAKLAGYVASIADDPDKSNRPEHERQFDIGSMVKKGQILAELAIPELDQEWKQKKALVRQAEAEVVQSEKAFAAAVAGVAAASAMVVEAEASVARAQALYDRWQSEMMRMTGLVKGGVIDLQTRDETTNQLKSAEAARNESAAKVASARATVSKAEADREKATADVEAAKAKLDVSKAEVGRVTALLEYTKIKAPFDGVLTRRTLNTGTYVTGNDKASLFTVARIDPVRVVVRVPEADAGLVASGQDIRITIQALNGPEKTGKVTRTSWSLEPGSRTLRTEIDLPNEKGIVRPGMYVHAKLMAELPAMWTLPVSAIGKMGDEPLAYLVEGGKAVRVPIQILRGDGQFTQIRRYKKAGSNEWSDVVGTESFASPASALADGQIVP